MTESDANRQHPANRPPPPISNGDRLAELLRKGLLDEARELADAMLRSDASDFVALRARAIIALRDADRRHGGHGEAERRFRDLIGREPGEAEMHYYLGLVLQRQGDIPEASKSYFRALQLDQTYAPARQKLEQLAPHLLKPSHASPTQLRSDTAAGKVNAHPPTFIPDGYVGTVEGLKIGERSRQRGPFTAYQEAFKRPVDAFIAFNLATDDARVFAVEMRAREIKGMDSLNNGARVSVPPKLDHTQTLRVKKIEVIHRDGGSNLITAHGAGAIANTSRGLTIGAAAVFSVFALAFMTIVFMYLLFGVGPIHGDPGFHGLLGGDSSTSASTTAAAKSDTATRGSSTSTKPPTKVACAITPSPVARIYNAPDPFAANTSVPVASYPVIKREQVPFGGSSSEWYEIRVHGHSAWIDDDPGQIVANSCGPV